MALHIDSKDAFTYLSREVVPATPFRFVVNFNKSVNIGTSSGNANDNNTDILLHVNSGTFPFKVFEDTNATRGNRRVYYPSFYDVSDVTINFIESDSNVVWDWYYNWFDSMFYKDGKGKKYNHLFNVPSVYKKNFFVYRLSSDFSRVHALKYIGAYPKSINDFEYDYSSNSEILKINITFSVDDVDFASSKLEKPNPVNWSYYDMYKSEHESPEYKQQDIDFSRRTKSDAKYPKWEERWALSTGVLANILG